MDVRSSACGNDASGTLDARRCANDETMPQQHRSIANMIAVMIRDYCGRNGFAIPEPGARDAGRKKTTTGSSK
jgi:hypothetical protein